MKHLRDTMMAHAIGALAHCYAPYSHYQVSACMRCEDEQFFCGANIENSSYGLTLCAEATAIAAMIMAGYRAIKEIVIINHSDQYCTPCGACRQRIREFAADDILIHCGNHIEIKKTFTLAQLLPESFGAHNLEVTV